MDFGRVSRSKVQHLAPDDPAGWITHAIVALDEAHNLSAFPVAAALRGRAGLLKFIGLPPIDEKNLAKLVHYEVSHQIHPLDLKDVTWQHQRVEPTPEKSKKYLADGLVIFIARNDQIDALAQPFESAGVGLDLVQIHAIALANYAAFELLDDRLTGEKIALIDVGAESTGMVLTDGSRLWHRNIPIGGDHFTRDLAKELNLPFEKAERLKRNAAKAPNSIAVYGAMRKRYHDIAEEIERCVKFLSSISGPGEIRRVIALGGGCKLAGFETFLRETLGGIAVSHPRPSSRLAMSVGTEILQDDFGSFAAAEGLALQALGYGRLSTNLLPLKRRAHRSQSRSSALVRFARSLLSR